MISHVAPLVLLGDTRSRSIVAQLQTRGWGRMWVESNPTPYPGEPWGFDNGAFVNWRNNRPFDGDSYERRLERARAVVPAPYLAVLPDLVGAGLQSLEFSMLWRERIGADEWPWYLAVQDGMNVEDVAPVLDGMAGIFLGGSTRFKSSAPQWASFAHAHGIKFHYARASTIPRVLDARVIGADSLDSAFPLWSRSRLAEFIEAAEGNTRQLRCWDPRIVNLVAEEYL